MEVSLSTRRIGSVEKPPFYPQKIPVSVPGNIPREVMDSCMEVKIPA